MIKVKIEQVLVVADILKRQLECPFSASDAFDIAKMIVELNKYLEPFEMAKTKVFEKYSEKEEKNKDDIVLFQSGPKQYKIIDQENCSKEIDVLLKKEVEIAAEPMRVDLFNNMQLTPVEAIALIDFIK